MATLYDHPEIVRAVGDEVPDVLRQKCDDVDPKAKSTRRLCKKLLSLLTSDPTAAGLAAPQIGVTEAVVAVRLSTGIRAMVNPRITHASTQMAQAEESCLSLDPGLRCLCIRALALDLQFFNQKGQLKAMRASGYDARIIQHELDHLDGRLITDRAEETLNAALAVNASFEDPVAR